MRHSHCRTDAGTKREVDAGRTRVALRSGAERGISTSPICTSRARLRSGQGTSAKLPRFVWLPYQHRAKPVFGAWCLDMCNLYSVTKGQQAMRQLTLAMLDTTGNLPSMPAVFPDYPAPVVRNLPDGGRELTLMRWGFPPPPKFGTQPVTNVRNPARPYWRGWLKPD